MGIFSSLFPALFSADTYTPDEETSVVSMTNSRPPIVEFYRYLRFWSPIDDMIDSNSGITFKVVLDYEHGLIEYVGAICENDNFSRVRGRDILNSPLFNREVSKIHMNYNQYTGKYEIDPDLGTVGMIVDHLTQTNLNRKILLNGADKLYQRIIERMKVIGYVPLCELYNESRLREEGFI